MPTHSKSPPCIPALALALACLAAPGLRAAALQGPGLFVEASPSSSQALSPGIKRSKKWRLNPDWLAVSRGLKAGDRFHLPLFPGGGTMRIMRGLQKPQGSFLYGELQGIRGSRAHLAMVGGVMAGEVSLPSGEVYRIRSDGAQGHWLEELEAPRAGLDADSVQPPVAAMLSGQGFISQAPRSFCGAVSPPVDLLVVYTPKAVLDSGGLAALTAQVEAEIFFANITYANSGVDFSLRLAALQPVSYTETANVNDLYRLQAPADGYLDSVHALRDGYGADFVMMWVGAGQPYGGIAYVLNPSLPTAHQWAFGLISTVGSLRTLAHEVGHNMGLAHVYPDVGGLQPWGRGYPIPFAGGNIGTIMGGGLLGLDQFSNPLLSYDGVPTGKAAPASDAADAARALNQGYPYFEAFRAAPTPGTPPSVALTSPSASGPFQAMASLTLTADAAAFGSGIAKVEFRLDNALVGTDTTPPYSAVVAHLPAGEHFLFVSAVDGAGRRADPCPLAIQVPSSLPYPWAEAFLSHPWNWEAQPPPAASYSAGQFELYGSGEMGGIADREFLVHQRLCGDGEIRARVASQEGTSDWAVAALTMRASTAAQAPFIQISVARNG